MGVRAKRFGTFPHVPSVLLAAPSLWRFFEPHPVCLYQYRGGMLRLNVPIIRGSCQPRLLAKRDCHTPLQRAPCSETYGTFGCSGIQHAVVLLEVAFDALDQSAYHTLRRLTPSVGSPALTNVVSRMVCHFTLAIVFHPLSFVASILQWNRFPP